MIQVPIRRADPKCVRTDADCLPSARNKFFQAQAIIE